MMHVGLINVPRPNPRYYDTLNQSLTDVKIHMGDGEVIKAHKVILAMRSDYFREYFEAQHSGVCDLQLLVGYDPDLVKKAVELMYGEQQKIEIEKQKNFLTLLHDMKVDFWVKLRELDGYVSSQPSSVFLPSEIIADGRTAIESCSSVCSMDKSTAL